MLPLPQRPSSSSAFDGETPVLSGYGSELVSTIVPRALLEQRAWTEALEELKKSNLPSVHCPNLVSLKNLDADVRLTSWATALSKRQPGSLRTDLCFSSITLRRRQSDQLLA